MGSNSVSLDVYISRCVKSFAVYDIATVTMLTFVVNFANMSFKFRVVEPDVRRRVI